MLNILACPKCKESFTLDENKLICQNCDLTYSRNEKQFFFMGGRNEYHDPKNNSTSFPSRHWRTGRLIELLKDEKISSKKTLLNIGAGKFTDKSFLESNGFLAIGTDIDYNENIDVICKAEELPFKDNSIDVITMLSVLEHVDNPFKVFNEIERVLKPGGCLINSSAFLEPYHSFSKFHISHYGLEYLCSSNNLRIEYLGPGWDGITAFFVSFIPGFRKISFLSSIYFSSVIKIRRTLFQLKYRSNTKKRDELVNTDSMRYSGSIILKCRKP